jgi:hypothetical protein
MAGAGGRIMMQGLRSLPSQPEMCEGFVIEGAADWVTIRGVGGASSWMSTAEQSRCGDISASGSARASAR